MKKVFSIAMIFFAMTASLFSSHKVVYLISPPRSMSVAFTRMMQARGDFEIYHEPSQYAYDKIYYPELTAGWFRGEAIPTFEQVKSELLTKAEQKNVFAKEVSFAVEEFLLNNLTFVQNPAVQFVFLIRNPHHTAISFYYKLGVWPEELNFLIGYKAEYEIFQFVKKHAVNKPFILMTEDLYNRPEETIKAFCERLEMPFLPESMHWSDLSADFTGEQEWHELKVPNITHHWHGDAIRSTGFSKPRPYEVDEQNKPTFSEIKNENHRLLIQQAYLENLPYYEKLMSEHEYFLLPVDK
ncbi:MAG TPA: hypothetical protein VMR37_01755 [Rhabdochlamydiaceae bacterium]|nr:hypothetical protein [Rhabdochlamydiaceae bacterium]